MVDAAGFVRPRSREHLRITGPNPSDPIEIVANTFSDPADMKALIGAIALCREIGNPAAMAPFVNREVIQSIQLAIVSGMAEGQR